MDFKRKPYIIAEIGSNWHDLADCKEAISIAKNCDADAVKFQMHTPEELYGFKDERYIHASNIIWSEPHLINPDYAIVDYGIKRDWIPELKSKADAVGIEFMCSAFSGDGYDYINKFVNYHKIASAEAVDYTILDKVRSFKKPMFISTGAMGLQDVVKVNAHLKDSEVIWLYCDAHYPAYDPDLYMLPRMKTTPGLMKRPVGFSDHSKSRLILPYLACNKFGADVLEKHLNTTKHRTADSNHSITPDHFKVMTYHIRANDHEFTMDIDQDMKLIHSRRLIAIRSIFEGEKLELYKNIDARRLTRACADALPANPEVIGKISGRRALRDIPKLSPITLKDIMA